LNHFQKLEDHSLIKNEGLSCQYLNNCDETITFLMHLSNTVDTHKEETASGSTGSKEQVNSSCLL
jgi:hypothetical protein